MRPLRVLSLLTVLLTCAGLSGLLLWHWSGNTLPLAIGMLSLLFASVFLALEIIIKREEYVSHGDSWAWGYIQGFQAVMSGVSHLVLVLTVLGAGAIWFLAGAQTLQHYLRDYPGALLLLGGLWLFTHYVGVIFGQAISLVGYYADSVAEKIIHGINILLEKGISLVLCLAGLVLVIVGGVSLLSGKGPLEVVFG